MTHPRLALPLVVGLLAAGLALLSPFDAVAPALATPARQDAARGQELYVRIGCYQCHGFVGQGSVMTGPRLAPGPVPLERFQRALWEPFDRMPRYAPEWVSAADVADIYAFLATIPEPAENIPLLGQ